MAMAKIWTVMVSLSIVCGLISGKGEAVASAAMEGAKAAVTLCISILGIMCLWTGVMEIMRQSGLAAKLARLLRPALSRLFPGSKGDPEIMEPLSANVSANLLGLGNAATPLGLKAAQAMHRKFGGAAACDDLCTLVVINSASIQLVPATVAAVRASAGCATPFDILPAVWMASVMAAGAGIIAAKLCARASRRKSGGGRAGITRRRT